MDGENVPVLIYGTTDRLKNDLASWVTGDPVCDVINASSFCDPFFLGVASMFLNLCESYSASYGVVIT